MPISCYGFQKTDLVQNKEVKEILDRVNKIDDYKWCVSERPKTMGSMWWKRTFYAYQLAYNVGHGEYQIINFYQEESDTTINIEVCADEIVAYLYGRLSIERYKK